jgi:hypothetical protein
MGMIDFNNLETEELEYMLPISFQKKEARERPCGSECPLGKYERTIEYEQRLWRYDTYNGNKYKRVYQISYRDKNNPMAAISFFETERHYSFRKALIEMYEILAEAGIIKEEMP